MLHRLDVATIHAPVEHVAPRIGDTAAELERLTADRCRLTIGGDTSTGCWSD